MRARHQLALPFVVTGHSLVDEGHHFIQRLLEITSHNEVTLLLLDSRTCY